ncbi:MAG: FG-GAP-like repeat-containing protein, partial [Bacteroidales bacterium]|nr:FG-GAP-like repeat-containing protein [Bacteroidales bacterium]
MKTQFTIRILITVLLINIGFIFNICAQNSGNALGFVDLNNAFFETATAPQTIPEFTISGWFYNSDPPSPFQEIWYLEIPGFIEIRTQANYFNVYLNYPGTGGVLAIESIPSSEVNGKWFHVAITYDGVYLSGYFNGKLVNHKFISTQFGDPTGPLKIGVNLMGYVDEVQIWDKAWSEIKPFMYKQLTGTEPGLLHYYKFDESAGTTAYDAAGSLDLHAVNMPSPNWYSSWAWQGAKSALDFDGINDYVECGHGPLVSFDQLTIELWVWLENPANDQKICGKWADWNNYYVLGVGSGKLYCEINANGNAISFMEGNVPYHQWTHLALIFSKGNGGNNGTCYGYVNGAKVFEKTDVADASIYVNNPSYPFRIGCTPWNVNTFLVDGQIDEVRVWGVSRSETEIRDNMCRSLPTPLSGLQAYWRFNVFGGSYLYEFSGSYGLGGILHNMDDDDWVKSFAYNTWTGRYDNDWGYPVNWTFGDYPSSGVGNAGIINNPGYPPPNISTDNYACYVLSVSTGSTLSISGGHKLLINGNCFSNGTVDGSGNVEIAGNVANQGIIGSFAHLTKSGPNATLLLGDLNISGSIILTNGDIDLNSHIITLDNDAILNETPGNTLTGTSGFITTTRTFNAGDLSAGVDIAGMGAEITTDQALGQTTISRGVAIQYDNSHQSITRYYNIDPANNSGLEASLGFHYDDTEMNGNNENKLLLFSSEDSGSTWIGEGGEVNVANNTITLGNIDSFSRWTAFDHMSFSLINPGFPMLTGCSVAWGDYDYDEDLDALISGFSDGIGNVAQIYRNDGSNDFTDINAGLTGVVYSNVAWGDYDNDSDLDILITGHTGSQYISIIYRNDGSDTFTDINAGLPGMAHSTSAWSDYDNDGDLDILLTGSYQAYVFRNEGADVFTDIGAALPGVSNSGVAWGDYDNDGDMDILLTGAQDSWPNFNPISRIYRNEGLDIFTEIDVGLENVAFSSVAFGDYDNDGDLDIALTGRVNTTTHASGIYQNVGSGIFTKVTGINIAELIFPSIDWGDYDNDGDLDLIMTGSGPSLNDATRIYRNDD